MEHNWLPTLVLLAGIGHLVLVLGSLFIPFILDWKSDLAKLPKLLQNLFWTYSGYILGIHVFFGIITLYAKDELMSGSKLGLGLSMFITIYWLVRIILQFTYYDRSQVDEGLLFKLGEWALMILFAYFVVVYGMTYYFSL